MMSIPYRKATIEKPEISVARNLSNDIRKRVRMDDIGLLETNDEDQMRYPSTPHPAKKQKGMSDDSSKEHVGRVEVDIHSSSYESPPAIIMTTSSDSEKLPGIPDEDPEWDELIKHEPAKTDVPIFLAARDRRDQSDERFAAMLDEFHASYKASTDALLQFAADIYDMHREKLDFMEGNVKQSMVWNNETRARMEQTVAELATTSQGAIAGLLMRLNGVMKRNEQKEM